MNPSVRVCLTRTLLLVTIATSLVGGPVEPGRRSQLAAVASPVAYAPDSCPTP